MAWLPIAPIDLPSEHQISPSNLPLGPKRLGQYPNKTMLALLEVNPTLGGETNCHGRYPLGLFVFLPNTKFHLHSAFAPTNNASMTKFCIRTNFTALHWLNAHKLQQNRMWDWFEVNAHWIIFCEQNIPFIFQSDSCTPSHVTFSTKIWNLLPST